MAKDTFAYDHSRAKALSRRWADGEDEIAKHCAAELVLAVAEIERLKASTVYTTLDVAMAERNRARRQAFEEAATMVERFLAEWEFSNDLVINSVVDRLRDKAKE